MVPVVEKSKMSLIFRKNIFYIEEVKNIIYIEEVKNIFYSNLSKFITYVISYIIINYPKSPHHTPPPPHLSKSFFYIFEKSFSEMLVVVDEVEILYKIKFF